MTNYLLEHSSPLSAGAHRLRTRAFRWRRVETSVDGGVLVMPARVIASKMECLACHNTLPYYLRASANRSHTDATHVGAFPHPGSLLSVIRAILLTMTTQEGLDIENRLFWGGKLASPRDVVNA